MPLRTVDASTLKHWIDTGVALVIDVREPAENKAESIAGATLMPLAGVCKSALPIHAGKKLVIHCRKGGRGGTACEKLLAEDPNLEIYNLEGGIAAWTEAGYPVQSSGKLFLPLDRQVQLTIGFGRAAWQYTGIFRQSGLFPAQWLLWCRTYLCRTHRLLWPCHAHGPDAMESGLCG